MRRARVTMLCGETLCTNLAAVRFRLSDRTTPDYLCDGHVRELLDRCGKTLDDLERELGEFTYIHEDGSESRPVHR